MSRKKKPLSPSETVAEEMLTAYCEANGKRLHGYERTFVREILLDGIYADYEKHIADGLEELKRYRKEKRKAKKEFDSFFKKPDT